MVKMIFSEQQPPVWYIPVDDGVADIVICLNEEAIQVDDPDEPEGYHTDYRYDYNKFRTDTLTEDEVLVSPERYLMFGKDYFSESDRIDFLDTEFAKTDLANVQDGAVTEEKIADEAITREKLTADDIEGVNGKINLREGTFDYGDGKLRWDGETLDVEGIIRALAGYIADWEIGDDLYKDEAHEENDLFDGVDSSAGTKIEIRLSPETYEMDGEIPRYKKVVSSRMYPTLEGEEINGYGRGFYILSDGSFLFGEENPGMPGGQLFFNAAQNLLDVGIRNLYLTEEVQDKRTTGNFKPIMATSDAQGKIITCDTGWLSLPLASGVSASSGTPQYRKSGNQVEVRAVL